MFAKLFGRERQSAPKGAAALGPTGHVDTFTRDSLPPARQWPDLLLDRPEFQYPEYLNAAVELTDRLVEKGFGDNTALIGNGRRRAHEQARADDRADAQRDERPRPERPLQRVFTGRRAVGKEAVN